MEDNTEEIIDLVSFDIFKIGIFVLGQTKLLHR